MKKVRSIIVNTLVLGCLSFGSAKSDDIITGYDFEGNGWQTKLACFEANTKQDNLNNVRVKSNAKLRAGINNQLTVLKRSANSPNSKAQNHQELIENLEHVSTLIKQENVSIALSDFTYHRISGEDNCGNVLLTGYFTPTIELKRQPDSLYRYPFYVLPATHSGLRALTRKQIDIERGLDGLDLEIGYSASLLDNYIVHIQGSSYAKFIETKELITLGFAGKNKHKYASLGKHLVDKGLIAKDEISLPAIRHFFKKHPDKLSQMLAINPSYVFFTETGNAPLTSSNVPALNGVTAAVDPKFIPHGSLLLIEYPILNADLKVVDREYKFLIASDSGSAIKGNGHIDIYYGDDREAAGSLKHYGQVWIMSR